MKTSTAVFLFVVILLAALAANLLALYVAAQQVQKQLSGVSTNPTVAAITSLFGKS